MSLTKELLAGACGDGSTGRACPTAAVAGLQIKPCRCRRRRLDDDARFIQTSIQNPTYSLAPTAIDKQPPPAPGATSATGAGGVPYDGPTRSIGANSFPLPLSEEEGEGGYYHYLMTRIDEVGGVGTGLESRVGWDGSWGGRGPAGAIRITDRFLCTNKQALLGEETKQEQLRRESEVEIRRIPPGACVGVCVPR